jgi:hypothetical protein
MVETAKAKNENYQSRNNKTARTISCSGYRLLNNSDQPQGHIAKQVEYYDSTKRTLLFIHG